MQRHCFWCSSAVTLIVCNNLKVFRVLLRMQIRCLICYYNLPRFGGDYCSVCDYLLLCSCCTEEFAPGVSSWCFDRLCHLIVARPGPNIGQFSA